MIDLYSWPTPNGHKIHIMLEECGLAYNVIPVNIGTGDQFKADFLRISPNNKIPALVDFDGPADEHANLHTDQQTSAPFSLFESGAILMYLAEKTGQFLSTNPQKKYATLQWLMFQVGGFGPMLGQAHHFRLYAPEPVPYAIDRYTNEARRLYGVINRQLETNRYLAGDEYSIADIATFPWARSWQNQGIDWADFPHAKRWFDEINARPAVQRGIQVLADLRKP